MAATYRLVVTGDVIMNSPVSACRDPDVLSALDLVRGADVTHAHLEIPLHDFDAADVFPAAEGAMSWMRGPTFVADELRRLGVDAVSTASNHTLDFSYGGLRRTLETLDAAAIAHAGSGRDLAAARAPAFADTPAGRFALVSATSSFPAFGRAGATRTDFAGRPGVNPQRYVHLVDEQAAETVISLAGQLGLWAVRDGDEFVVHPPGLHNSIRRFRVVGELSPPDTACDADDLAGNLDSVRYAASVADFVLAHLHVQEWNGADGDLSSTPSFAREYARMAVAAGAGLVLVQGSHAPMRGIEVHDGVPIFYDPGPLFRLGRRETQPHDFYTRWGNAPSVRSFDAVPLDAYAARDTALDKARDRRVHSPQRGYGHTPGFVLPECEVDAATHRVSRVRLYPMSWSTARRATTGFPVRLEGERASVVLDHLADLCAPLGTRLIRHEATTEVVC